MKFTKMHGCGNDYVLVDSTRDTYEHESEIARAVCARRYGIGADGIIFVKKSDKADFMMDMYKSDGSVGEMCGNSVRCLGKYVYDYHLTNKTDITVDTPTGIRPLKLFPEKFGRIAKVKVDMGTPDYSVSKVPVIFPKNQFIDEPLEIKGIIYHATCLSMGNPHCVVFMEKNIKRLNLEKTGPNFSQHPSFPKGINVEFANVIDREHIYVRTWERGIGETLASGTGATAAVAAAVRLDLMDKKVEAEFSGGKVMISYDDEQDRLFMTGPVEMVYEGEIDISPEEVSENDVKIYKID
jgi:diaminopimelate epimerase